MNESSINFLGGARSIIRDSFGISVKNSHQTDNNNNGIGDACESIAISGDLDGDGDVDNDDYQIFLTAYGSCTGDANFIQGADLDSDGCVTINDYRILRSLVTP